MKWSRHCCVHNTTLIIIYTNIKNKLTKYLFLVLIEYWYCEFYFLIEHHLGVPDPHGGEVPPEPGHQDGGDEGEGDQVQQGGLGGVHEEEGDEGGDQAEDVS